MQREKILTSKKWVNPIDAYEIFSSTHTNEFMQNKHKIVDQEKINANLIYHYSKNEK